MKIKVIGFELIIGSLIVFFLLFTTLSTFGDISGGPGTAITPYDKSVNLDQIKQVKEKSSKARRIRNVELKEGKRLGLYDEVGLGFVVNKEIKPEPSYKFIGEKDKSGEIVEIDFSEIKSLSVIQTNDRALVEVVKFPDITPEDLFKTNPKYSHLKNNFIRFWLEIKDKGKGELNLVGKGYSGQLEAIAKIQNIKLNTIIEFDYGTFAYGPRNIPSIWWATPSVIEDPSYPYKIFIKK